MVLAGVAVDIGCFSKHPAQNGTSEFFDRFSVFSELAKLSQASWFSAEIGAREAFGNEAVLSGAVSGFRELLLFPSLFTTGIHFDDRGRTVNHLEELGGGGVQQIILRVNEEEARALSSDCVRNLVEGCHAGAIDLKLQFELGDAFTEDCCRIARTVEDRQFTVTVVPLRVRPTRRVPLSEALPIEQKERLQIVVNESGEVMLRRRTPQEVVDIRAGNAQERPLHELVTAAPAGA